MAVVLKAGGLIEMDGQLWRGRTVGEVILVYARAVLL